MELNNSQPSRSSLLPPPPPPPKMNFDSPFPSPDLPPVPDYFNAKSPSLPSSPSRHLDSTGPLSPPSNGASEPRLTPPSPNPAASDLTQVPPSPGGSSLKGKQSKKTNPLTDLVDSEREYVDLLAGIIRKVAGAWSRTNFPPQRLDDMFRGIEVVFKANRALLTRLKNVGPTPTSPKALGDLLMRWIDDLDAPYTKYCTNYATGFDGWHPIVSNTRLPAILIALSAIHPPPLSLLPTPPPDADPGTAPTWTLDALFALPRARLKYYKKLYARLLKSTQPGRSDHKLLIGAVEKLENLSAMLLERERIVIGQEESTLDKPDRDNRVLSADGPRVLSGSETTDEPRGSVGSSMPPSSLSSEARASRDTVASRNGGRTASSATMSMPISDLEGRLSTERVLDIFTLKSKSVRLQMNPPSLPFTRTMRLSHNVEIHFTPRLTPNSPIAHPRGHIFLLTDLFLVCERMTPEERQSANSGGQDYDMWLLYPPLAGKHLRVSEYSDQDNVVQVQILKKEILFLHAESKDARDCLIKEFKECIEAANLVSPKTGLPAPPPVPPLKAIPSPLSEQPAHDREQRLGPSSVPSSTVSPVSLSSGGSSPQPPDPSRSLGVTIDNARHASTRNQNGTQQPLDTKGLPSHPGVSSVPSSAVSPVSLSSGGSSPQPPDPSRSLGVTIDNARHASTRNQIGTQQPLITKGLPSHPGVGLDPSDSRGPRLPPHSASQPQLRPSDPPGPNMQYNPNPTSPPPSAPLIPPARGASNPQRQFTPGPITPGPIEPPMRPSTAPGQRQPNGVPNQPGYPGQHPRTQNPGYPQPHPSLQGSLPNGHSAIPGSGRPPPEPMANAHLRKSSSARSLGAQYQSGPPPPVPSYPARPDTARSSGGFPPRDEFVNFASVPHVHQPLPRVPFPPSASLNPRSDSFATTASWSPSTREPSPPSSPLDEESVPQGPVTSTITAQFKCKVFLQLHHGQWKSLGGARLKLYLQQPTNIKQLVVEADSKDKNMLISTIVLTDGVERVGRTGVAIELSDKGARTGIVYMIQLRNETSASGLFDSLLEGSDRAAGRAGKG